MRAIYILFILVLLTCMNTSKICKYLVYIKWILIISSIFLFNDLNLFIPNILENIYIKIMILGCILLSLFYKQEKNGIFEIQTYDYIMLITHNIIYIPIYEELYYRYFILQNLISCLPLKIAYSIGILVFIINHDNKHLRYFYLIPITISLSIIYHQAGIIYSIILHIIINMIYFIIFVNNNIVLINRSR